MRDRNEFDVERPDLDTAAGRNHGDWNFRRIALGSAFGLEQGGAELRRVDRAFQLRPELDNGAEVIFVGMRQDQADEILALFLQKLNIGHDQVDARQVFLVAKGHAEIDREPGALVAVAEPIDRQIHADLADAAKRRKGQFVRSRHQAAPADATEPKCTSPAEIGTRWPSEVRTIRQPASSMVSKMPSTAEPLVWIATFCPSPAARSSQSRRISLKPRPLSQVPRNCAQVSDRVANNSSALIWTPNAASDVAGVGVPSGAATTLVPMPTTTASRLPRGSRSNYTGPSPE